MYGSNIWGIPNRMSFNDHLYQWDVSQNARFPASVKTSTTPTSNDDLTNKKYVDSLASSTLSSSKSYTDTKSTETLLDVDSLPEITDANRNRIIRYNGKLYSVSNKYTGTAQDLSVGADLSSAKLVLSFPNNLYTSGYFGVGNLTFITTEGSAISSYNGSSNNYMCCISIGTHGLFGSPIYAANTNTKEVLTNMVSYIMPSNAGKITELKDLSVVQNTGFYVNLTPYIKYIPATEAWICIDNEIAVGESEPTGQEKLWINPKEDDIDISELLPIKIITGVIPGSSYDKDSKTQTVVIDYPSGFNASNTIVIASMLKPVSTDCTSTYSGRVDVLLYSSGEYANKMEVLFSEAWGLDMYYKIVLMKM